MYILYIMSKTTSSTKPNNTNKNKKRGLGIYMKNVITRKINIPFNAIGGNIKENIEEFLKNDIEGKCIDEGYIKPNSINIINYSAGLIKAIIQCSQ